MQRYSPGTQAAQALAATPNSQWRALAQGSSELVFEMPAFTRDMAVAVQGFVVLFCGALAWMLRPLLVRAHARWRRTA